MPSIQIDGARLEYIEQGSGDPLVLVHGTLGDHRSWELQMDAFAEGHRTIAYSRRYHYPNACEGNESDYSAALHADDLSAFMAGLGLESADIVGNSYGAYTALFLAARHPEQVRRLVLAEPPALPLLEHSSKGRALRDDFLETAWEPAAELLQRGDTENGLRLFVDGVVDEGAFDRFPPEVRGLILDNACEFKVETSSPDYWTPFTSEDAERITATTLLLTGENSLPMLQLVVAELERCLPNNECVTIPDSTHEMPADNPEAYNATVLEFLAKQPAHVGDL